MTPNLIPGKLYLFSKTSINKHHDSNAKDFIAIFVGYINRYEYQCLKQNGKMSYHIDTWWDLTELK